MAVKTVVIPPEAEGMKTGMFLRRFLPSLPESTVRTASGFHGIRLSVPARRFRFFFLHLRKTPSPCGSYSKTRTSCS